MSSVLPSPTLVVGVGCFGLRVLERLGEDWMSLKLSGADPSIKNLRLIAVRSTGETRTDAAWRLKDRTTARVAEFTGEGDLPSLALDFVILRSLGLVRYYDGVYEVALPKDEGLIDVTVAPGAEPSTVEGDGRGQPLRRQRFFAWLRLSPDPLVAAERLQLMVQRYKDLDLFLTPLLNRVKRGHSPKALMATLNRCSALRAGRDPSPWAWLVHRLREIAVGQERSLPVSRLLTDITDSEVAEPERSIRQETHLPRVPEPLPGWKRWLESQAGEPSLHLPEMFRPGDGDAESPFDPIELLGWAWETTGWASTERRFVPAEASPLRLGLFDHDERQESAPLLADRLRSLSEHLHRGLIRLWVDLQRDRVEEVDPHVIVQARHRMHLDDSLRQSLEILGELVVRPVMNATEDEPGGDGRPSSLPETTLPDEPSSYLASMVVESATRQEPGQRLLLSRLSQLGLTRPGELERDRHYLLSDVRLAPEDLPTPNHAAELPPDGGLRELREQLNRHVRHLFGLPFLAEYRNRPTRRPPRLSVFVVGDMSEPFARATMRPVLRAIHRELLRAFTPIFRSYREGFDRSLCVTPILWMPHPADPFKGGAPEETRKEEASIIDAIHGIRRWAECMWPAGRRFVPQIFVNSRVTDSATLPIEEAVRQTRDFLSFQIRNDLSTDPWLRRTATASGGSDLFSSFSCYEIDFPALRCREYLANRLGRDLLTWTREGNQKGGEELEPAATPEPPRVETLVERACEAVRKSTRKAAEALEGYVLGRASEPLGPRARILAAFDERFERDLLGRVQDTWRVMTGRMGEVDEQVDELRRKVARLLVENLDELRKRNDRLIEEQAAESGLHCTLAQLKRWRDAARTQLRTQEGERREAAALAERHAVPSLKPALSAARERVIQAAHRRPEERALRWGLGIWALLSLVLGAPVAHTLAHAFDLHLQRGFLELLLGPLGAVSGGLLLFLPAWLLTHLHVRRRSAAISEAIRDLARASARVLSGTGGEIRQEERPSVLSFLESRLELTGAVAVRGFALRVLERAQADADQARRLVRSIDAQSQILSRRAEDLGVRAVQTDADRDEDLSNLLDSGSGDSRDLLIGPRELQKYYRHRVGEPREVRSKTAAFLEAGGGFAEWRRRACLADTEALLAYCRQEFQSIVGQTVSEQDFFADEVGDRLVRFVSRIYPNLGFGAEFKGYEGLDPDGVQLLADVSLVLHRDLEAVLEKARRRLQSQAPLTQTLEIRRAAVRPNVAYMLSLVQGIRVHSVRNLKRFESFHDRQGMPDDGRFPLSHEALAGLTSPLNPLTGYEGTALRIAAEDRDE